MDIYLIEEKNIARIRLRTSIYRFAGNILNVISLELINERISPYRERSQATFLIQANSLGINYLIH